METINCLKSARKTDPVGLFFLRLRKHYLRRRDDSGIVKVLVVRKACHKHCSVVFRKKTKLKLFLFPFQRHVISITTSPATHHDVGGPKTLTYDRTHYQEYTPSSAPHH
jgi:hypothetical protein